MRELATADRIRRLIEALGERARGPGRIYLVGGATAVLERGHAQDLLDVEQLFGRSLVTAQQLRDGFDSIRAALIRYPGIDADSFATKVDDALRQPVAAPEPNDDTFPNAESEPPQLYFQSPDPGRVFAVFGFFREYLEEASQFAYRVRWLGAVVSLLVVVAEILCLILGKGRLLGLAVGWHPATDIVASALAVVMLFRLLAEPKGLWITPKREMRLLYLANQAIRGDLRDNPLVTIVFSIIAAVLTGCRMTARASNGAKKTHQVPGRARVARRLTGV